MFIARLSSPLLCPEWGVTDASWQNKLELMEHDVQKLVCNVLEAMQASRLALHQVLLDIKDACDGSPRYFAPVKIGIDADVYARAPAIGFA